MTDAGQSRGGCGGVGCAIFLVAIVIGAIVAAAISLAALVDPFNWMPTVAQIWADCEGDCELAHRFPGFWLHAVANLAYAAIALAVTLAFGAAVLDMRAARARRYASAEADAAFRTASDKCLGAGIVLAALAAVPLIVALA